MRASLISLEAMVWRKPNTEIRPQKLKTNSKTWRWTCCGVELHFVLKRGKFSVYRRNNELTFVFADIKGEFEAICWKNRVRRQF